MSRFEDVDVLASLHQIMEQNTVSYQTDFEIDRDILTRAARETDEPKTFLWISREHGTHCFPERNVFIRDTAAYHTVQYHAELTKSRVLAYTVEITGMADRTVTGNICAQDFRKYAAHIADKAVSSGKTRLVYENGERMQDNDSRIRGVDDPALGKFLRFEHVPDNPEALRAALLEEKRSRARMTSGDFKAHLSALRKGRNRGDLGKPSIRAQLIKQRSTEQTPKKRVMTKTKGLEV